MRKPAAVYEGAACRACGSCTRYVSTGKCRSCQLKHTARYQRTAAGKNSQAEANRRYVHTPEGRERKNETHRAYYQTHKDIWRDYTQQPEVKARKNARFQERYHFDPAFRERHLQRSRDWHARKKAEANGETV